MAKKLRLTDEAVRAGRKKYDESGATVPFPVTSESGYNGYTIADKGKQYGISDQQAFRIESYRKKLEGYDWKKNYEYDNLDDEDVRRRQKGLIPKSLQKKYDLDDPVDVALYRNGLPARSIIDSQIKKAETEREKQHKSVRPEFIEEVREGAEKLMRQEARKHAIYRLLHGIPSEGKQAISLPLGVGKSKNESDANTWAAQQEAWQKQFDKEYAPLLGNPSDPAWAQRVQRGSMMELPEIMQRGNVSFTKSAHAISSNPYYISDEDKYWDYFTQDERNIFNYLMAESREKALEFYEFMKPKLSERFTQEEARRASEWSQEDPFCANMGSVAAASVEGLRAAPYALKQGLTGEVNDPYSAANALIAARDSVYSTTEDAIGSDPLRMLYAAAYASGESLSRRGADLILPGAGTGLAALSGFARGSRDATMRGATPTEALLSGAGGAAIEGVIEKIGGDRFFKQLGKLGTSTGKDVLIQTMRSILAEGLEEGASGLIEPLFDWLVMGDKSNLVTAYNQRIDAGAKPKQAFRETFLHDYLAEAGEQALVGGLSGGMMGGVATGINTAIQNREAGKSIRETGALPEFLQEAVAEGTITEAQAQQKMSDFKVGSIVAKQQAKFNAETEGELAKTVPDKAAQKALARAVYGEEISKRQVKKIAANDAAKEAYLRLTGQEIDARMNPRSVTASLVNKQFYRATDEDARVMEATAEKLGNPEIAKIMTANFNGDTDAATYANAFERYYKGMQTGLTTEQIDEAMGDMRKDVLPAAAKMAISNLVAPKAAPDGDFWSMDEAQRREYGKTLSVGLNRRDTAKKLTRMQEIQLKALDIVAKKIGVKLVTHDSINKNLANGAYDPVSNTIHFALNAESDAFVGVSMHEMTHYIRQWNKAGYKVYEKVVLEALSEKADYDLEAEIAKVMEEQSKDRDRAIEEIVSNSSAAILSDEKLVKRLLEEDRTVVEKIRDFFKELLDTIKTTIASLGARDNWKEIKALKDDAETLEKMYNLFNAALNDAAQVAQTENALSVSASDADYAAEAAERKVVEESSQIKFSRKAPDEQNPWFRESQITRLRNEIEDLNDAMMFDEDPFSSKRLNAAQAELDKLIALERQASVRTHLTEIVENLDVYRPSDLRSILEQYDRNGEWDDMTTEEMRDYIRNEIAGQYSPLELQSKKRGFDVIPAEILRESNSSIRFSRKVPDEKELRKQLQSVKRFVPDYMANPKDVKILTDMLRKQYSATIPRDVLNQRLMRAAEQLHHDGDLETMLSTVSAIASDVVDSARVKDKDALEIYNHYAELRNRFRGEAGFSLTEEQQQEVASVYGSVQDFRKANMGRFVVRNDASSLDAQWEELSTMWPELFDPDTNAGDQPIVLAAVMEAMFKKPDQINPYEAEKDAAKADLTFNLTNLLGLVSEADFGAKLKARENELKSQHEAQLAQAQAELSDARMRAAERISELENRLEMAEADSNATAERREANLRAVAKDLRRQLVSARKAYDRLSTVTAARFIRMQNLMDTRITRAEDRVKRVQTRQQTRMYRARIERNVNELSAMLLKPDDARHIPEELRTTIGSFLRQIDVSESVTTLKNMWPAALRKLEAAIPEAEAWEFDLDPDMVVRIQNLLNEQGRIDAAGLNVAQLRELDMLIRDVKNLALKANKALAKGRSETIKELGDKTIAELSQKKRRTRHGSIAKLLTTDMLDATSFADDLGETGASIIRSLRKGFDVKVRDIAIAEKAISEILKGHKIKDLVKEKHEIAIDGNRKIELTTAQCMELYLLSKREQALGHIFGDGIRLGDNDKADTYTISKADLSAIIGKLTDEQKSLADALQRFVSTTVTEWGNETSMKMYGYKKFGEKNYWPIRTDKNTVSSNGLDQKNMDAAGFYRLKNLGTTQATKDGARNALHVNDVFDTLTSHINEMSSYHAFVAPLSDATRWYNYRPKKGPSVKQALEMTLGKEAQGYIENLLRDINSAKVSQRGTDIGDKMIQRARVASVGANFRVVIQQGTAWMRAAAVIDPKYLAASTAMKPNIKRMLEYCPIAQWKAFGFYDLDIGPSLRGLLLKDDGVWQKLQDWSLALAGFADSVTWAGIYNACYLEQKALHPELAGDKDALYRLAGDRLSEVVDRTQVVDSPFHRPDIMRAKNTYMREVTAFMSEPMKSYNLLRSAVVSGDKKRIARTASTFALTAVVTALAESVADAWRDEGKDSFREKIKAAFLPGDWDENTKWYAVLSEALGSNLVGNLNPANLFPFLRDAMSILEGFETERSDMSSVTRLLSVAKSIVSYLNGTGTKSKWDIAESAAQVISYATGMPIGNAVREVRDLVNKIIPGALE